MAVHVSFNTFCLSDSLQNLKWGKGRCFPKLLRNVVHYSHKKINKPCGEEKTYLKIIKKPSINTDS